MCIRGNIKSFLLLVYYFCRDCGLVWEFSPLLLGLKVFLKLEVFVADCCCCICCLGEMTTIGENGERASPKLFKESPSKEKGGGWIFFDSLISFAFARFTSDIIRLGGFSIKDGISEIKKSWLVKLFTLFWLFSTKYWTLSTPPWGTTSYSISYLFS